MSAAQNPSFYAGSQVQQQQLQQQQQQQRYNNIGNGQAGLPNGAGSPGAFVQQAGGAGITGGGRMQMPGQQQQMQAMGRSMSPQQQQLQAHQLAQLQSLPPHLQAQMMAAMTAAQSAANANAVNGQATPSPGAFRGASAGPQGMAKPSLPIDEQQQQFLQQQKARTAALNPAQLAAFMQAQSQAQAQIQAQAQQAQPSAQSASPQQRNISPQNPGYMPGNLSLPQQPQAQPGAIQYGQMLPPQQRQTSQSQLWQQPFQQQQQLRPGTASSSDQFSANAIAGPSRISPVPGADLSNMTASTGSGSLPPFSNGISSLPPGLQVPSHARRASIDQLELLERLRKAAQVPGGLPIQSIFTKTSWEPLNSVEPVASTSAAGGAAEEARDRKRKAFEPPPPVPEYTVYERRNLESWMKKDLRAVELAQREQVRMKEVLDDLGQDIVNAQDWLGPPKLTSASPKRPPGSSDGKGYRVRTKKDKLRDLAKGKRKSRPWLDYSKKQLREISQVEECLIPIRLDLEHDGRKINDTFTWNLNGTPTPRIERQAF